MALPDTINVNGVDYIRPGAFEQMVLDKLDFITTRLCGETKPAAGFLAEFKAVNTSGVTTAIKPRTAAALTPDERHALLDRYLAGNVFQATLAHDYGINAGDVSRVITAQATAEGRLEELRKVRGNNWTSGQARAKAAREQVTV